MKNFTLIREFCSISKKMRREFILVMLGIICISTLSSLLSSWAQVKTDKVLLDTVIGSVGCGNFSYWQLGHFGPLLIELTSLTGDADIYIADHIRPGYEVGANSFSSATCGHDMVYIPSKFPRPIGIGVFGHWSSDISEYSIQVFLDTSVELTDLEKTALYRGHKTHYDKTEMEKKRNKEKSSPQAGEEENKPRFLKFLGILDMVFEMFLM